MDHRIGLPVVGFFINGKTFEKLFFAFKNSLQGREGQRFTKAAGTGQKVSGTARTNKLPNIFGFVHIQKVPLYKFFKIINVAGKIFHYHILSCCVIYTALTPFSIILFHKRQKNTSSFFGRSRCGRFDNFEEF